jgi:hypothetical protein
MLFPKSIPRWMYVGLFLGSVVLVPLLYHLARRPVSSPSTPTELTVLLAQRAPSLYVISEVEHRPECGIYICTQPQLREQLSWLVRNPLILGTSRIGKWEGVVFCEKVEKLPGWKIEEHVLQSWGQHGMQIGPLLFFGDPSLLQRIREVIIPK